MDKATPAGWSNPLSSLIPLDALAAKDSLNVIDDEQLSTSSRGLSAASPLSDATSLSRPNLSYFGYGFPLNNRKEARYFMHYIHELAPWIDICDTRRHFALDVPRRAYYTPLLTYSILAFAAVQLDPMTDVGNENHELYYGEAIRLLIPTLNEASEIVSENTLAAIVILRLYEEFVDTDSCTHLAGVSRLINSASRFVNQGGLGEALSWIVLRQSIHVCLTKSEPVHINLDHFRSAINTMGSTDEDVANQIIFICVDIFSNSLQPGGITDISIWDTLKRNVLEWHQSLPTRFRPYFSHTLVENSAFPDVRMARPAQVLAYQHYHLSQTLLKIYDPQLWEPGVAALRRRSATNDSIRHDLRVLVGLAISNPETIGATFTAHHTLHFCGGCLQEEGERRDVLEFLNHFTFSAAWPTARLADKLRKEWDEE